MDINEMLGQIIKEKRTEKGLTQFELADLLGKTEQSIYYYERGSRTMSVNTYFEICRILNLDPYDVQKTLMKEAKAL